MEITEEELKKKIDEAVAKAKEGMLTQDQVNEVVSKRIGEVNEKHKKALEEQAKIAKMSAEEKQKHDFDELTKERDELKTSLLAKEHKENILSLMAEKKIDNSFYDVFSGISDTKTASEMMDTFNKSFEAKVNEAVESKINSHVPNKTITTTNDADLRRAFGL